MVVSVPRCKSAKIGKINSMLLCLSNEKWAYSVNIDMSDSYRLPSKGSNDRNKNIGNCDNQQTSMIIIFQLDFIFLGLVRHSL